MSDHLKPCALKDCAELASHFPVIFANAAGHDRNRATAAKLIVPLPVCRQHQESFDVQEFLLPETRDRLQAALRACGRAEADFEQAWVEWKRIGGAEWRDYHRMRAKAAGGGTA